MDQSTYVDSIGTTEVCKSTTSVTLYIEIDLLVVYALAMY